MTLEDLNALHNNDQPPNLRCDFILKQGKSPKKHNLDDAKKKSKKSSPFSGIFKRGGREEKATTTTTTPPGRLFGRQLSSVCQEDSSPPKPILDFLAVLCLEGPKIQGILRKNANAKMSRELRVRLDQGEEVEEVSPVVAGGLLKDYLRSLPDPLLTSGLHDDWISVANMTNDTERRDTIKQLVTQMPECNVSLLKRVLCALHYIQSHSEENKMNSYNLSLCIAPSLLWHKDPMDLSGSAPAVEFMIDRCQEIFGPEVLQLLQGPKPRPSDSGTDSDSYHSVLSMPETGNSDSIDSLVDRDLFTGECEGEEEEEAGPTRIKSHLSPSNLSRDSGLTLSDTQLYDDDCGEHPDRSAFRGYHHHHHHHYRNMRFHDRDDDESDCCAMDPPLNPIPPPRKRGKRPGSSDSGGHASRMDSGGGSIRTRDKRHTLHSSVSSSRLLDQAPRDSISSTHSATLEALRNTYTHPSFSSNSEDFDQTSGMDREELQQYNRSMDIGMLRKSASGAHLILEDDTTLPRKFSEGSVAGDGVFRQSSGVDSTPPLSPQSKYSYSSRDSAISDSSHGIVSRESSITSAPQTPDTDYADRLPPWLPAVTDMSGVGDSRLALSLNLQHQVPVTSMEGNGGLSASYDISRLRSINPHYLPSPPDSPETEDQDYGPLSFDESYQSHTFQLSPPSPWKGRSHEAEDVLQASPHIEITPYSATSEEKLPDPAQEDVTLRPSPSSSTSMFPLEIAQPPSQGMPIKKMSKYSQSLIKSPPPRVLLQSLRSPRCGMDPAPVKASHDSGIVAQVHRAGFSSSAQQDSGEGDAEADKVSSQGSEDTQESGGAVGFSSDVSSAPAAFNAARSMEDAINDTEYISVKPRLTIIKREESIHSNASSVSSASSGKSSVSSVTLSTTSSSSASSSMTLAGDQSRPTRPPEYNEAVKRSLILKQEVLDTEAQAQKEASKKAKSLFENSMQRYLQDRPDQSHGRHATAGRKISDPGTSFSGLDRFGRHQSEHHRSVSPNLGASSVSENVHVDTRSKTAGKNARQIYLESLQRYEQQVTTRGPGEVKPKSIKTDSSKDVTVKDSKHAVRDPNCAGDDRTARTVQTGQSWIQLRANTSNTHRTNVNKDARPKSMLDLPNTNLHRSFSDSADRLNKLGLKNASSHIDVREKRADDKQSASSGASTTHTPVRKISETAVHERRRLFEPQTRRHTFLTPSYFYNPDDSPRSETSSPSTRSPRSQSPQHGASASRQSRVDNDSAESSSSARQFTGKPTRSKSPDPRTRASTVSSGPHGHGASLGARSSSLDSNSSSQPADTDTKRKSQLGWSVKNLATIFNTENNSRSEQVTRNPTRSSQPAGSSGQTGAPPPYQDPPPFRRLHDKSRLSTSSSSSNGSTSTGRSGSPTLRGSAAFSRKQGPQNVGVDSSEELGHGSSRWSHDHSASSSGVSDQEATNPYTDISYV